MPDTQIGKARLGVLSHVVLLIRQKLKDAVKNDISIYYPYVVPDNITRADTLSYQVYGDTKYTWTIFLVNNCDWGLFCRFLYLLGFKNRSGSKCYVGYH